MADGCVILICYENDSYLPKNCSFRVSRLAGTEANPRPQQTSKMESFACAGPGYASAAVVQLSFTCLKSTIETLEKGVEYNQS